MQAPKSGRLAYPESLPSGLAYCKNVDTPRALGPHPLLEELSLEELGLLIKHQLWLFDKQAQVDRNFTSDAFGNYAAGIDEFFKQYPTLHNGTRWTSLPRQPNAESDLYPFFVDVLRKIVDHFNIQERYIYDCSKHKVYHQEQLLTNFRTSQRLLYTSPDIMALRIPPDVDVQGSGNAIRELVSYANCFVPLEIKRKCNNNFTDHRVQIALYAQQCFTEQLNRLFVYTAICNEDEMTLYRFDRGGVLFSETINIHNQRDTFVKWLRGIMSDKTGFDRSMNWRNDAWHVMVTETAKGRNGDEDVDVEYPIYPRCLVYQEQALCGTATTYWEVKRGRVSRFVTQSWGSVLRSPEEDYLQSAIGLDGVAQMIGKKTVTSISELRGSFQLSQHQDRELKRVTYEGYRGSIKHCVTRLELLEAFRDAIAGHRNLLTHLGIIHRNIHLYTVLRGAKGAGPGNRGVVIDLSMAASIKRTDSLAGKDVRMSAPTFQSVKTLLNPTRPHDHLDDLESFVSVLTWVCLEYTGPAVPKKKAQYPKILQRWSSKDPRKCALEKDYAFRLFDSEIKPHVGEGFGAPFVQLLEDLNNIIRPRYPGVLRPRDSTEHPKSLEELFPNAEDDYHKVFEAIDRAIQTVEIAEGIREEEVTKVPAGTEPVFTTRPPHGPIPQRSLGVGTADAVSGSKLPENSSASAGIISSEELKDKEAHKLGKPDSDHAEAGKSPQIAGTPTRSSSGTQKLELLSTQDALNSPAHASGLKRKASRLTMLTNSDGLRTPDTDTPNGIQHHQVAQAAPATPQKKAAPHSKGTPRRPKTPWRRKVRRRISQEETNEPGSSPPAAPAGTLSFLSIPKVRGKECTPPPPSSPTPVYTPEAPKPSKTQRPRARGKSTRNKKGKGKENSEDPEDHDELVDESASDVQPSTSGAKGRTRKQSPLSLSFPKISWPKVARKTKK
ncbi:hypothetical protein AX16_006383 [Volvariella volvacea WC 439]|nr:hypothetical protein AX16_006383 [Volvariella volvacea WC 439]